MELGTLLEGLSSKTSAEFKTMPEVVEAGDSVDVATLPIEARRWTRISDVVAVVADLKSSTQLGTGSKAASTASIYEAGTGGVVKIFDSFSADFLQIQGDGAFALFWGDMRFERAAAAGITIKTFSVDFTEKIEAKWPTKPETGFKVGIASHRVLVKRVGTPAIRHNKNRYGQASQSTMRRKLRSLQTAMSWWSLDQYGINSRRTTTWRSHALAEMARATRSGRTLRFRVSKRTRQRRKDANYCPLGVTSMAKNSVTQFLMARSAAMMSTTFGKTESEARWPTRCGLRPGKSVRVGTLGELACQSDDCRSRTP